MAKNIKRTQKSNSEEEDTNNVYYKDSDGNFKPFGINLRNNYIPDGIWYVRHTEHCSQTTSVDYLLGLYKLYDIKDLSISEICSLHDYSDYILGSDEFEKLTTNKHGFSYQELVSCIISLVFKRNREILDKEKSINDNIKSNI
jgi:hypothetical protein